MLGTNNIEGLGIKITYSDGSVVESDTIDKKGETASPKESLEECITSNLDCSKSINYITNKPKEPVTSKEDYGKSVESAIINNPKGSVTSNQDCSISNVEEALCDEKLSPELVYHAVLSDELKLGPLQT